MCYDLPFFEGLETCKNLQSLELHYYENFMGTPDETTDIKYDNLRFVEMNITNQWELEILTRCKNLRYVKIIDIRGEPEISDELSFNNCQNITHLDISEYNDNSLKFHQIKKLRTLVINLNQNKPNVENVEIIVAPLK